jgi:hypothetical protein
MTPLLRLADAGADAYQNHPLECAASVQVVSSGVLDQRRRLCYNEDCLEQRRSQFLFAPSKIEALIKAAHPLWQQSVWYDAHQPSR